MSLSIRVILQATSLPESSVDSEDSCKDAEPSDDKDSSL